MQKEFKILKSFFYFYIGLDGIHIEIEPMQEILEKRKSKKVINIIVSCLVIDLGDSE